MEAGEGAREEVGFALQIAGETLRRNETPGAAVPAIEGQVLQGGAGGRVEFDLEARGPLAAGVDEVERALEGELGR